MKRVSPAYFLLLLPLGGCLATQSEGAALSAADRAAIRALDSAYVAGWLANDAGAVLATLDPEVILMPAGNRPLIGLDAARGFWWPSDGSRTTITSYTATIDELDGTPALAYVRGTSTLAFTYERDTLRANGTSKTLTLTLLRKSPDGRWRITRRMWGPLAN